MNIVILTDTYYPEMSATSACIDKYIQKLKSNHHIDIICPISRVNYFSFNDSNIELHCVSSPMWKLRMQCEENIRYGKYSVLNTFFIKLFKIRSLLLSPFSYPTIMSWQLRYFYNELKEIQANKKIDVIISVVNPICSSFVALKFKKQNPQIKWINFFMDPFTYQPSKYKYVFFKKNRWKRNYIHEKEIYDTADYNFFTEELYKSALKDFNQPLSKTFKMKYVLSKIEVSNNVGYIPGNKCRLVYAGALRIDVRNPIRTLEVLSKVNNIIFDMYINYANCDDVLNKFLSEKIHRYPSVNRKMYNELICNQYDILVNIGNNFALQIPSKMFELLSTGRPIINFYQLRDSQYEMIERYPLGLNIGPDDKNAEKKVTDFCEQMKGKRFNFDEVKDLFPENTIENQLLLIEDLISN